LQALLAIQTPGALVVDGPSLPSQQDVDAPMAVSDAGFRQLANTLAETGLLGTTMPVVVGRTIETKSTTGTPDADPVTGSKILDQLPGPEQAS